MNELKIPCTEAPSEEVKNLIIDTILRSCGWRPWRSVPFDKFRHRYERLGYTFHETAVNFLNNFYGIGISLNFNRRWFQRKDVAKNASSKERALSAIRDNFQTEGGMNIHSLHEKEIAEFSSDLANYFIGFGVSYTYGYLRPPYRSRAFEQETRIGLQSLKDVIGSSVTPIGVIFDRSSTKPDELQKQAKSWYWQKIFGLREPSEPSLPRMFNSPKYPTNELFLAENGHILMPHSYGVNYDIVVYKDYRHLIWNFYGCGCTEYNVYLDTGCGHIDL